MNTVFCAEESRQAREDPIGSALAYQTYILVECPPPWTANALNSKLIPDSLRAFKAEISQTKASVRLLLMHSENLRHNSTRCLIFQQQTGFSAGYHKQEFQVPDIRDVASALRDYLQHQQPQEITDPVRDIVICTHGSNDQCCARYGNPFYRQALSTTSQLSLDQVRIWKTSHFSGHRFAPTAIDFPEGRYYGRLDPASFASILTRTGDIHCLKQVYRGWGILPDPLQVLERELILRHGWDWFNYRAACQVLEQHEDDGWSRVELSFLAPNGSGGRYRADVVEDQDKTLYLKGECSSTEVYRTPQYTLENLVMLPLQVVP